jgi:hypothetical protein
LIKRFWVGWSSRLEAVETAYPKWKTSARRLGVGMPFMFSYAAVVDAGDREAAWQKVVSLYADAEELFVKEKPNDFWPPADRYPKAS